MVGASRGRDISTKRSGWNDILAKELTNQVRVRINPNGNQSGCGESVPAYEDGSTYLIFWNRGTRRGNIESGRTVGGSDEFGRTAFPRTRECPATFGASICTSSESYLANA